MSNSQPSLTPREHFAAEAMKVLLRENRMATGARKDDYGNVRAADIARQAAEVADALVYELALPRGGQGG